MKAIPTSFLAWFIGSIICTPSLAQLSLTPAWFYNMNQIHSEYGHSVSSAGDVNDDGYDDVIVGAPLFGNTSGATGDCDKGKVYVYYGSATGLPATASWTAEVGIMLSRLGESVACAGDVNADGYDDIIVGAYGYDAATTGCGSTTERGAVFIWFGSATGLGPTGTFANADWKVIGTVPNARMGFSVSGAGDVDGDGIDDIIVGSPHYANGHVLEGRVEVYHGAPVIGPSMTPNWVVESNVIGAQFGRSVASAGDVNGDGISDVIIGAPYYDAGSGFAGRAFVYYGAFGGLPATASWVFDSPQVNADLGWNVDSAGDVNDDGISDIIIGSPQYDGVFSNSGRAYVFHGASMGLPVSPNWIAEGDEVGGAFGLSVGTAGDVSGDLIDDIIISAGSQDGIFTNSGEAFVWHGSSTGLGVNGNTTNADWSMEGPQNSATFGSSVATAGDVNGDGCCDVIIGIEGFGLSLNGEGRAEVYYGCDTPLPIELAYFKANWSNSTSQVLLTWKVFSDIEEYAIFVERKFANQEWTNIGIGERNAMLEFNFTDSTVRHDAQGDQVYYRLAYIDQDGRVEYSSIQSLVVPLSDFISISPNPFTDRILIRLPIKTSHVKIQLFDIRGNSQKEADYLIYSSDPIIQLEDLAYLPTGLYFLHIQTPTASVISKLVKP